MDQGSATERRIEMTSGSRRMFDGGLVLPEQLTTQTSFVDCGSGRLMKAILEDAIGCLLSENARLREESAAWIFAEEPGRLFSFLGVCDALGIDPRALRAHLSSETARPPVAAA